MERSHTTRAPGSPEVIVVGARCGGAATAMLLARQGVDVLLVDRADFPSDTLSTHAIARGGVVQLGRWGLLGEVLASGAPPIRTLSFTTPEGTLVKQVKNVAGVDHLLAPRRHVLDLILVEAARAAGASIWTGVNVTGTLTDATGRVVGVSTRNRSGADGEVRARFVVGADGVRSRVARAVGARVVDGRAPSGAMRYAYVAGLDATGFEFHLAPGSFAGVFPTHNGEANVWIGAPRGTAVEVKDNSWTSFTDLLEGTSPSLAARVRQAEMVSPVRFASGLPNHVLEAAGPGWALVGDAGYHRDPITGHGITDAFRDAELLAVHLAQVLSGEAHEGAAMAAFAAERQRALEPIFDVTCRLSAFPPVDEFVEAQKHLARLLDAEATWLAELPPLPAAGPTAIAV